MAKIPVYQEKSHLSGLSPVGAVDPALARREGERMQQLGSQVLQFNRSLDSYLGLKRSADDAVLRNEIKAAAQSLGHKGLLFAKENPEAAPDGSSMDEDFNQTVRPLFERISQLPKNRQDQARGMALVELQSYQQKVREAKANRYNAYLGETTVKSANRTVLNIMNNPETWEASLSNHLELIESMPVSVDERLRASKEAKLEASLAVVNGYEMQKNFEGARRWLLSEESRYLDRDQRQKALDRINSREVQHKTQAFQEEERMHREADRLERVQREEKKAELWAKMVEAESPDQRAEVLDEALLLGDPVFYRGLNTQGTVQVGEQSNLSEFLYTVDIANANFDGFQRRLSLSVEAGELTPQAATRLIKRAQAEKNKVSGNPTYALQRKQATQLVQAALPPNRRFEGRLEGYDEAQMERRILVESRAMELQEKEGLDPVSATRKALNEVRISQGQSIIVPNVPPQFTTSAARLSERMKVIDANFMSIEDPTPEQVREYRKTLEAAKLKLEALQASEEMRGIFGGER